MLKGVDLELDELATTSVDVQGTLEINGLRGALGNVSQCSSTVKEVNVIGLDVAIPDRYLLLCNHSTPSLEPYAATHSE